MIVQGRKGGKAGGSQRVAQEAPNTLQSKAVLRVIEFISEGEAVGLVDGAKSIYFDGTPLQNPDGSYNFQGTVFEQRFGTPDQAYIAGFSDVEAEEAVGVEVKTTAPVVRTITDADIDAVRVTIRIPILTSQDTSNGDLNGTSVQIKIEYQPNGGSYIQAVSPEQGTISGKTTSPYERQYRINLTGSPPWNIRVTRVTPDSTSSALQNQTYFASYTKIINHKLNYPDTAIVSAIIDSSLFGASVPTREYDYKGILVKIPTNYNPITRVYTGVWDGTFTRAWSDNPVWVLYDLITNARYGIGDRVDAASVDKYAFYAISQYCDELVDDGKGGLEPRFTFNGVLESEEDAMRVLQTVASVFRGMIYAGSLGSSAVLTAVHDAPKDAIKIFTPANVKDGVFNYSGAAAESKHSAIFVTWHDPSNGYRPSIEVVESPFIASMAIYRKLDVVAYGCTSRGQAHRFGKWILDSEQNESEQIRFTVDLADADLRPGDVIKVFDPSIADVRFGGRLLGSTSTSVTLDAAITLESGQSYEIDIAMPDGTLATRAVTNAAGVHSVLNFTTALPATPVAYAMWAVTATNLAPRQFRILGLKESDNDPTKFDITGLLYDSTKFARVEQDINLPTVSFTKLMSGAVLPPTNLTFVEYLLDSGTAKKSAVTISWEASPDSRVVRYVLEIKNQSTANVYQKAVETNALSYTIDNTSDGTWSFRVRAFDALNNPSAYIELADQTLLINSTPPSDVEDFQVTALETTSTLSWSPVLSKNLSHYEIRFSPVLVGAEWNTAVIAIERVSADSTSTIVGSRTGTFLIKGVSVATATAPFGVYSTNAAAVSTDIDFLIKYNFVETLTEDPTFSGTKTHVVVRSGNLELDEVSAGVFYGTGTYLHNGVIDLGAVYTSRVTPSIVASGSLSTNLVDGWSNVDTVTNVDGVVDGLWDLEVRMSTTMDDPGGTPTWSDYAPLSMGDVNARAFRFATFFWSYHPNVTPSIENLSVTVDMPDMIQSGENISSLSTGTKSVTFPETFYSTRPAVVITPQSMQTGDYYQVSSITASGFNIDFYNSSNTRIVRTFDYHTKGAGVLN